MQVVFCEKKGPVIISQYCFNSQDWITITNNHKRPSKGKTYAIDEGISGQWSPLINTFVGQHLRGRGVRWTGSSVVDVHYQLRNGGCYIDYYFSSPKMGNSSLLAEAIPLSFIWEHAGQGAALTVDDCINIMDVPVSDGLNTRCTLALFGEVEAKDFNRVRGCAPLWSGGNTKEKAKVEQTKSMTSIKQEVGLLRTALVIGAVINILIFLRSQR